MSETELRTYSASYKKLTVTKAGKFAQLVARKGNTQILFWIAEGELNSYQLTWTYPLTHYAAALKTNLCTGEKYVELHLVGHSVHSGATVWLDGERVGELSNSGTYNQDVPIGIHLLRVEKGGSRWRTELRYNRTSSGYDRVPIPEDVLRE